MSLSYRYISTEIEGGVAVMTIDDPENKNAVNQEMNAEMADFVAKVDTDPAARVLILTGTGHIFCSGGNIKQMSAQGKSIEDPSHELRSQLFPHRHGIRNVVLRLHRCSKPTIAAINGAAVGSGVGLAAGCDIRVAASGAQLGWVFARRGIVPDDASLALVGRLIGYANAYLWGLTGRTIDATEAERIGFLQAVVPSEDLLPYCRRLAAEIIDGVPPLTAQLFKMALVKDFDRELDDAVDFAERAQTLSRATEDHTEALRGYAEKRSPRWRGR